MIKRAIYEKGDTVVVGTNNALGTIVNIRIDESSDDTEPVYTVMFKNGVEEEFRESDLRVLLME